MNIYKLSETPIENIIGSYFIRACKNHDVYSIFRSRFQPEKSRTYVKPDGGECKNIYEMFHSVYNMQRRDDRYRGRNEDKYEHVTKMINIMLQYYLENGGVHPNNLGQIGQEIFNLSCYAIYGQEFLDDMEREKKEMKTEFPNDFNGFCMHHYTNLQRIRQIPNDLSFEDFVNHFKPILKKQYNLFKR